MSPAEFYKAFTIGIVVSVIGKTSNHAWRIWSRATNFGVQISKDEDLVSALDLIDEMFKLRIKFVS